MKKLEGYNSRVERLGELVAQLEAGKLNLDELIELESITRELHERSIILRYNAFKEKTSESDLIEEEEFEGIEVEVTIEELDQEEVTTEEAPSIDLSIFDTIEEESNTSESAKKQETEGQSLQENVEEIIDDSSSIAEDSGTEDLIFDETVTKAGTSESFLERLQLDDDSVASRFSAGKLETLIGAFGLNQRLRYINDLFDGSSEMFSEAIKMLDSQTALDVANEKAAQLAVQHSWDPEEEVVVEFMSFVNRRYA
ncbi:MAG: hypothetical protein P8H43_08295 [Crocinitomicaceae bacterium]|nr:hypothetical protein [Crocinitomicaceae bacterium]